MYLNALDSILATVVPEPGRGAIAFPPIFGKSVNLIPTRGTSILGNSNLVPTSGNSNVLHLTASLS